MFAMHNFRIELKSSRLKSLYKRDGVTPSKNSVFTILGENVAVPDSGSLGKRRVGYVVDGRRLLPGYHIDRTSEQKLHPDRLHPYEPACFFTAIFHHGLLRRNI